MKAVLWNKYGPPEVLKMGEVVKPIPKEDEVLIKIHAASVTLGDCEIRSLSLGFFISFMMRLMFGILRPKNRILGQEFSGEIVEVGNKVSNLSVGDLVFGTPGLKFACYAEYITIKADRKEGVLVKKPEQLSFEEAVVLPVGGLEALNFISSSNLSKGESILINGAGGSIGTMAVQLAKYYGAEVTAVDRTDKLDFLKQVGADRVIDYQTHDFTRLGETYDVILDVVGKAHFDRTMKCFNKGGRFMIANPNFALMIKSRLSQITTDVKIFMDMTVQNNNDMYKFIKLVNEGYIKVYVDKVYPLEEIVDAHRYVEQGNKKGNLVIRI